MRRKFPEEPIDLIHEIVDLYHEARTPLYPHDSIQRGESRAIYAHTEDLFACYLAKQFEGDIKILVNQNLTFQLPGVSNKKPDITIISKNNNTKKDEAKVFIDLKMDLGHKRQEFIKTYNNSRDWLKKAKNKSFNYYRWELKEKNGIACKVSRSAIWIYIVISDSNMSKANAIAIKKHCGKNSYFLLEGFHANTYDVTQKFSEEHKLKVVPKKLLEKKQIKSIIEKNNKGSVEKTFGSFLKRIEDALK